MIIRSLVNPISISKFQRCILSLLTGLATAVYFDFGIMHVANKRYNDSLKVDDKIENVKVGVWLERFWYGLENNNLLL